MENRRDNITEDIKQFTQDAKMEEIYYILLSLCREYSLELMNGLITKDDCFAKLKQIKSDMKQLDKQELINKTNSLYYPTLKTLEKKHYGFRRIN